MSLLLPILIFTIGLGLFVPRMTRGLWVLLAGWILLVIIANFFKPPAVSASSQKPAGQSRNQHGSSFRQA